MSDDAHCTSTAETGFGTAVCAREADHGGGQHISASGYVWFDAVMREDRDPSIERQLTGRKHDDLFYELFSRLARLEQGRYADGPATDDMISSVRSALGEVERRMTQLEGAFGELRAGEFRPALPRRESDQREARQWRIDTTAKLNAMWKVLAAMAPIIDSLAGAVVEPPLRPMCGEPDHIGRLHCEREPGHDGRHTSGNSSWPVRCPATHPANDKRCAKSRGHRGPHDTHPSGWPERSSTTWKDPDPAPAQTERASGSPAAVRCPTQYREGQCLGYAGHDGECSAVPDTGNSQLEDPSEFECGAESYPGLGHPPCGLPKGHEGAHASGPVDQD